MDLRAALLEVVLGCQGWNEDGYLGFFVVMVRVEDVDMD